MIVYDWNMLKIYWKVLIYTFKPMKNNTECTINNDYNPFPAHFPRAYLTQTHLYNQYLYQDNISKWYLWMCQARALKKSKKVSQSILSI